MTVTTFYISEIFYIVFISLHIIVMSTVIHILTSNFTKRKKNLNDKAKQKSTCKKFVNFDYKEMHYKNIPNLIIFCRGLKSEVGKFFSYITIYHFIKINTYLILVICIAAQMK